MPSKMGGYTVVVLCFGLCSLSCPTAVHGLLPKSVPQDSYFELAVDYMMLSTTCQPCIDNARPTALTFKLLGDKKRRVKCDDAVSNRKVVKPGNHFTLNVKSDSEKLPLQLNIRVGRTTITISTSCTQPLNIGMTFNNILEITGFEDRNGICPQQACDACTEGKQVHALEFRTLSNKTEQVFVQDALCDGCGPVSQDKTFTVSGGNEGRKLKKELDITVGQIVVDIHASCSQPLSMGQVFENSIKIYGFEYTDGYTNENVCQAPHQVGGRDCRMMTSRQNQQFKRKFKRAVVASSNSKIKKGWFGVILDFDYDTCVLTATAKFKNTKVSPPVEDIAEAGENIIGTTIQSSGFFNHRTAEHSAVQLFVPKGKKGKAITQEIESGKTSKSVVGAVVATVTVLLISIVAIVVWKFRRMSGHLDINDKNTLTVATTDVSETDIGEYDGSDGIFHSNII